MEGGRASEADGFGREGNLQREIKSSSSSSSSQGERRFCEKRWTDFESKNLNFGSGRKTEILIDVRCSTGGRQIPRQITRLQRNISDASSSYSDIPTRF